jgi:hypothetical protein
MNGSANTPNGDELQGFPPLDAGPRYPNHVRDLAPELARIAVFIIAIGPGPEDHRLHHETLVAGCEGAKCALPLTASRAPLDRGATP